MCSQNCLDKMKTLCLNTVQMLLRDAFHDFSKSLCNQNLSAIDLIPQQTVKSNPNDCKEIDCSKIDSTELIESNDRMINEQKATTSTQSTIENDNLIKLNIDRNSQNSKDNLSQLVLCNLMQNLVNAINDQCIKQLSPSSTNEKKKRKRKRKRKKSKPSTVDTEIYIENLQCSPHDQNSHRQSDEQAASNEKRNRSNDQIRDSQSSMLVSRTLGKHNRCIQKSLSKNKFINSKKSQLDQTGELSKSVRVNEHPIGQCSSNLLDSPAHNSSKHHYLKFNRDNRKSNKRKRNDSPDYNDKKRITSARKLPTNYTRKDSSSSSYSDRSESDDSFSSSDSSSSDHE